MRAGAAAPRLRLPGDVAGPVPFAVMAEPPPPSTDPHRPPRRTATRPRSRGEIETGWQDRWEREGTFLTPNPVGDLSEGFDKVADAPQAVRAGHVPVPQRRGPARRPPAGLHRHRRLRPLPAHDRPQRGPHHGLRRLRPARRAVRGADRPAPPRSPPRPTSPPCAASCGAWAWATTRAGRSPPSTRATTAGRSGSSCRSSTPGTTPTPTGPGPSPTWWPSWTPGTREPGEGTNPTGRPWAELSATERRVVVDNHRLAYVNEAPVNWCPALGTVLANEEVTADGRSERGNFPVFQAPAEAVDDAHHRLRRPAAGRPGPARLARADQADAAQLDRPVRGRPHHVPDHGRPGIEVFTTRPDTLFGATYMVLAPEHPLVEELTAPTGRTACRPSWTGGHATPAEAVAAYRRQAAPAVRRRAPGRVPREDRRVLGQLRRQPHHRRRDPGVHRRLRADGLRHRGDHGGARPGRARLGVRRGLRPADRPHGPAARGLRRQGLRGRGPGHQQRQRRGRAWTAWASPRPSAGSSTGWRPRGLGTGTVTYKLRDWLFSRQRFWGEPFPIVYDPDDGLPRALPESMLPVVLPDVEDYSPATFADDDETSGAGAAAGRATDWVEVDARPGRGHQDLPPRDQHDAAVGGSCWYELRYLDPDNDKALVDPENERYWMGPRDGGRLRRRRPVRRRRRARRAAPAVRPVLAQGAVRPGARVVVRAVPPPVQPGA